MSSNSQVSCSDYAAHLTVCLEVETLQTRGFHMGRWQRPSVMEKKPKLCKEKHQGGEYRAR